MVIKLIAADMGSFVLGYPIYRYQQAEAGERAADPAIAIDF